MTPYERMLKKLYGVRKTTFDKIHFKSMTNYQELCNVHPFTVANWFLISLLDLFHKVNTSEVQTYVWRSINIRSCIIYYDVLYLSSVKFPEEKVLRVLHNSDLPLTYYHFKDLRLKQNTIL